MNTLTGTTLIAALAAAAFMSGAQAAEPAVTTQQDQVTAQQDQATAQPGPSTAQPDRDSAEESSAVKPARTLDRNWWREERARDDGYGDMR